MAGGEGTVCVLAGSFNQDPLTRKANRLWCAPSTGCHQCGLHHCSCHLCFLLSISISLLRVLRLPQNADAETGKNGRLKQKLPQIFGLVVKHFFGQEFEDATAALHSTLQ